MLNLKSTSTQVLLAATIAVAGFALFGCGSQTPPFERPMVIDPASAPVVTHNATDAQILSAVTAARQSADDLLLQGKISVTDAKRVAASADSIVNGLILAKAATSPDAAAAQRQAAIATAATLTALVASWSTK